MVKYHPDTRFLTDYAAGSLPESQALCVAAHLHYCGSCRARVRELTRLGAELFMDQAPREVSDDSFDRILARIDAADATAAAGVAVTGAAAQAGGPRESAASTAQLPLSIRKLTGGNLEKLSWRKVGKSFRYSTVHINDREGEGRCKLPAGRVRETSLLHIRAGGNVPKHHHHGDEITVVLKGSFSDQEDQYHVGDYIVRSGGETHTPVASQDEDCLCLSTLDAPIIMNNWFYRLLMPFVNRPTPH